MNILGIIPARGGSKGVPNKNIKLLDGRPLLAYTSEIALASKQLSKVILSSEDQRIIDVAKDLQIEVPFVRPKHLAEDNTPTLPVLLHVLDFYEAQDIHFDAVCILQVTTPFRTVAFLDQALKKFKETSIDSLVSVLEIPHEYNPHWAFIHNDDNMLKIATGDEQIISRRQELPKAFHRDGSIYITRTNILKERKSLFGDTIGYIESSKDTYVNIDTLSDWEKAEELAIQLNK
ncbi:acylneuraminate cytidylyltransferase family protein [Flavobacteriaceae bacterium S356]|uniref:Acylneuraminate cytidylyltransferase family protein n=1 Tax=Asprobacillus argus TaxID=3076534 RepID=A0ABU3LE49_9FLAO|nr:acylneuraminate cytidylyltransferase family protein [Flavobacteriaceae bacterium S356]